MVKMVKIEEIIEITYNLAPSSAEDPGMIFGTSASSFPPYYEGQCIYLNDEKQDIHSKYEIVEIQHSCSISKINDDVELRRFQMDVYVKSSGEGNS